VTSAAGIESAAMDYEAIRAGMASAIPFNTHLGLEVVELGPGRGVVRLPDRGELRNHVGSQHAGALFAAGEAASGGAFVGAFADRLGDITPLAEGAEISYRKIARGTITATGRLSADRDELLDELDDEGTVRFTVEVELANGAGDRVADMSVRWHVRANDGS
jgi:acyl-coenzyme A thioesterase PaaI-like protein